MFSSLQMLDSELHATWRLVPFNYAFAREVQACPATLGEFRALCRHMPLLFVDRGQGMESCALLGLRPLENLLVSPTGDWLVENVPMHFRRYPFSLLEDAQHRMIMGLDPEAACLKHEGSTGIPLFAEDGRSPSEAIARVFASLVDYQNDWLRTRQFCAALVELGLLVPRQLEASVRDEHFKVPGFFVVDENRLPLAVDVLADWRTNGWLSAIEAHLISLDAMRDLGLALEKRVADKQSNTVTEAAGSSTVLH